MSALKQENEIITYEKGIYKMSKHENDIDINKLKKEIVNDVSEIIKESIQNSKRSNISWINIVSIIGGILGIIAIIWGVGYNVIVPITRHEDGIAELKTYLVDIKEDVGKLSGELSDLRVLVYTNNGNQNSYSYESGSADAKKLDFYDEYAPEIDVASNEPELKETKWKKLVEIATDEDGNGYTSSDLYNVKFTTSYKEDGKEIYFLGQYNDKSRWNGLCVLNVYSGDNLESVLEAVYNDGKLYSYKRISYEKDGTWKVVDKISEEDYKIGETWIYDKTNAYKKNISFDNYEESQILNYEDLAYIEKGELISYYNGKTFDGKYNDDSGDAYLVKYDTNGNVRYLYKGKVSDGYGNDDGKDEKKKSWAFIWGDANDGFHYHEGEFKNGTPQNTKKDWKYPVSIDFIKSIINPDDYNCHLTGLID
ncbi:MAG: hypothetical protein HDR03_09395 [Lachnospiraceae bacterium]|nr:hypothetical protein [Lachnospiraceae bacterium]